MSLKEYARNLLRLVPPTEQLQVTLAAEPSFRSDLCTNARLDDAAWTALWSTQQKGTEDAIALAGRALRSPQQALVLAKKRPAGVLKAFVAHNTPTTQDEVAAVLAVSSAQAVLLDLLERLTDSGAGADLCCTVGSQLTGSARFFWAATAPIEQISDEDVLDMINTMATWWGASKSYGRRAAALRQLFDARPALIDACVHADADESVITTLSGCRHLASHDVQARILGLDPVALESTSGQLAGTTYAHLALANNPRCHQDILTVLATRTTDPAVRESVVRRREAGRPTVESAFEDVTDTMVLAWLIKRSSPFYDSYSGDMKPGKPWELAALAANPHLSREQAEQVATNLALPEVRDVLDDTRYFSLLATLAAHFPDIDPELVGTSGALDDGTTDALEADATDSDAGSPDPEGITQVVASLNEEPVFQVLRSYSGYSGYSSPDHGREAAMDEFLLAHVGTDPRAWELLLHLVDDHHTDALGALADTCRRLAAVRAA